MRPSRIFILLLATNALVATGVVLIARAYFATENQAPPPQTIVKIVRAAPQISSTGLSNAPAAIQVIHTNAFRWQQVESVDYREYIQKLREIGCPENTIRDLVLTDLMKLFASRKGQVFEDGREFRYWETNEKRTLKQTEQQKRDQQLAALERELPAVVRELLGINYDRELNRYFVESNGDAKKLSFVDETRRDELLTLRDRFEAAREKIVAGRERGELTEEDLRNLQTIQTEETQALGLVLNEDELKEYRLRTSDLADQLRNDLVGFEPSSDEFRTIFAALAEHEEKFGYAQDQAEADAARAQVEQKIKEQLGPERAEQYERAKDPDYRGLVVFSTKHELPRQTTDAIYDIKKIAEAEKLRMIDDPKFPAPDKLVALLAMRSETEQSVRELLGEPLYKKYKSSEGTWIRMLGLPPLD